MKVLVLASWAESLIRFRGRLLARLASEGLSVHATAPGLSRNLQVRSTLGKMQCTCHDVYIARTGMNPLTDFFSLLKLVALMRREKPKYFLGYTVKPVIYGLLAARIAGVEHRTALITGLGSTFNTEDDRPPGMLQRIVTLLYRMALGGATRVVFQNPDDRNLFVKLGLVDAARTAVVNGSGVPLDEYVQRPMPPLDQCHFLFIGRLNRDKGVHEFVEAARHVKAKYPHAVFHIVGWIDSNPSSITQEELDAWIAAGLIVYHGRLDSVQDAIASSHVFVLPSRQGEGTPRSILEAMAIGRAVITTDAPGCRETVVDGDNGFLVPIRSASALATAMARFLEKPGLIGSMGQRSREIAEEKYDVEKVNAQMLKHMGVVRQDA
ncbi:MAG TPA: glycosyltransferase family 4 protein [Noviherbaspirillum sp.]